MKVLVFGGTHGNEWTGVSVVKNYSEGLKHKFPQLDLDFILGNPEAYQLGKRFKDEDLNRAFQFLQERREDSYEHKRAQEIKSLIEKEPCFIIDLHTTTSSMGSTVIVSHYNPINLHISSQLSQSLPDCRVIGSPDPYRKYLGSQSEYGLMIEVGPVANNLIEARALESTLKILENILHQLTQMPTALRGEATIYEEVEDVHYPVDHEGEIKAYIHSGFQGKDFQPMKGLFTVFQCFSGEHINYETKDELYPIFINEAAYYPQKLAFSLCRKVIKSY